MSLVRSQWKVVVSVRIVRTTFGTVEVYMGNLLGRVGTERKRQISEIEVVT